MEQYVTRIGDVTIQRVIPSGGGPPEPVRVMDGEELLRAVKEEPIDEDEEEGEEETPMEGEEVAPGEEDEKVEGKEDPEEEGEEEEEEEEEEEKIIIKAEPQDQEDLLGEGVETEQPLGEVQNEEDVQDEDKESEEVKEKSEEMDQTEEQNEENEKDSGESSKRKVLSENEDEEDSSTKKKKVEIDVDLDKKKISNLRRNIREVMDETQLDEATLAAQRQEAERLRRVQDQQKYIREVQRQIQLNRQNSKTQSRVISLLQGGSTSILKSSSVGSSTTATSTGPSTVLVKVGSGQQQVLNRKTLEVLRGGKSVSSSTEPMRTGIARVATTNKPAMVTPSVSIAPVKPVIQGDAQKKVPPNDADVVTISSSSDSENDCIVISEGEEEEEEEEEEEDDPTNSGMHTNDLYNIPDEQGRVLINVGKPEDEKEIFLAPQIARIIKPHQIGGVRFLFDNVVESIERFNNSTGFGCILAHSMGLGKTLQVVSFCDVFLRETSARTVMCIMPINTLQNWVAEFNMWLPMDPTNSPLAVHGEVRPRHFGIYVLNDINKTIASRAKVVEEWYREGGVLLIGYEMYRQLSLKRAARVRKGKKKQVEEDVDDEKNKPLLDAMHEALVKPGPDLVICDEGHRIKNSHASISHALKQIRTKRRVVLTGYPLQNNLLEYWCMVDFVRPNYLGTKTEFSNMFERPIQNGQCIDSTPQDIRLMRYRAHVLHSLLEGFVQRRSHSVLRNSLPQKEEYVLLVRMTPLQRKLYDTFMNEVVRTKAVPNPLKAFAVCCKIWNHPDILYNFLKKKEMDELQDLDLEETAALQQQQTGPNSPRRPLAKEKRGKKEVKKAQVAPIKAEVTSQPQSQPPTPDVKQEERKFDFPNPQPGPGYNYYPPPPLYPEVPYQYHRPPYYPGYYQEGPSGPHPPPPPFYHHPPPHGYEQGSYPGYYPGYDQPPYPKGEEFGKQPWGSPPFTAPTNIKQEKNQAKSPKEHESPSKPGFQEFYPKEEKPDIKDDKQTFMCGFSGGQVSFNYRNFPGNYPNYPHPANDYTAWNKAGFPSAPQGEPTMPGGQAPYQGSQDRHPGSTSGSTGSQPNMYSGQNIPESPQRGSQNQESSNPQHSQSIQHSASDRNQHGVSSDNHPNSANKDNQRRSHPSQDHPSSSHENIHGSYMNMPPNQKSSDHVRKPLPDLMPVNQIMHANKKHEGNSETMRRNQDSSLKNRNLQDNDQKHMQNASQQGLFNTHESTRNPHQLYGSRNSHDEFRMQFGSPDRQSSGPTNPHDQHSSHNSQSNKNNQQHQQYSNVSGPPDNQPRMQGNTEQNSSHIQNPFNNQRNDHNIRDPGSGSQNISVQNEQERMLGINQGIFGNQENQSSHEHSNRPYSSAEHFPSNPMNPYGNQRSEHNMSGNHEQGSHPNMGNQQIQEPPRRPSLSHENAHTQSNIFNSSRNDNIPQGFQDHGQMNPQNSPSAQEKQDMRNRHHGNHSGTQQMYNTQRNENEAHNQNTKHAGSQNLRGSDLSIHTNQEHLASDQGNMGMMSGSSHIYANQETGQGNQHSMFRGHNQHDGQHRGQNFYVNQYDHNVNTGQDHAQQSNHNNQNVLQNNQKRLTVNTDHQSAMTQNSYSNQSDHSVQKMIRNDSNIDNHQMMHSSQEHPPNQYMYPSHENMFHNQHSHHTSHVMNSQNSEKQNIQESQNNPHMARDRMLASQERQPNAPGMFNNQNVPDLRWHSNSERPLIQQNMYDQNQHCKDDNTNKDKQQYHGNQDYSTHNQQNIYGGQSNQSFHRNPESHSKSQAAVGHDGQYKLDKDRSHVDRNSGGMMSGVDKSSSQEIMQGSSQNRQNPQDHNMHNPHENMQNLQAGHNTHSNQHMQRNVPHSSQEQLHNMMGNKPSSYGHSNHPHPGTNAQSLNHNQDGAQNMSGIANYGIQNSPQQSHSSNQHNMQSMNNQNISRNQHNPLNNQEQQSVNNNQFSDGQNLYGPQYHMQSDQHNMNNQNIHGNQHMKNPHHIQNPTGQNLQAYGNHMPQGNPQGSNNNQGMAISMQNQGPMHPQNPNYNQNSPGNPISSQAQHGMPPMNQGQHGSSSQPNQGQHTSSVNQGQHTSMNQGQHTSINQGQHNSSMNQGQHSSSMNQQGPPGSSTLTQGQHGSSPLNQGSHGNPMGQGFHGSSPIQGPNGSQYQMHMNQSVPGNQYQNPNPSMHGSKDLSNQSSGNPGSYSGSHHSNQYMTNSNQQTNSHNIHSEHLALNQANSKIGHSQHMTGPSISHNKTQTTPTKNDFQKMQTSPLPQAPQHHQNQPISQQGTQTSLDNPGQASGAQHPQHRAQSMLNFQPGQTHNMSFEPNIIASSKSMSGGQVIQGVQQQKYNVHNVLGKNDDQNRSRSNFNEPMPPNNENYQGNFQKPGFYGQDFQFPYQGQFPYQDKAFSEQPGPSGQMLRKDDEKANDDRIKDCEKKIQESEDMVKTNTTSTSTETDDERRDKKEEDDKVEKKQDIKADSTTPQKSGKEDPGIPYDWAIELLKGYTPGDIAASAKMAVFFCILEESIALGDRILVFSQSLFTLNLMEELLQQQLVPGKENERWAKNINYYRLDGSTTAMEREKLINEFNSNANLHLFLVSTRAGSLGINLVGANRVIVFDASWNPCHDTQAVCRVYRYGQKKPCFVYRLVTDNCLEKKIYDRQINKQGMSDRVVDECNPDAHLSIKEVTSLCWDDKEDDATPKDFTSLQDQYIDVVLQKVIQKHSSQLSKEPFAHESLLVDRKEKKLSQAEKRLAKRSYELEKQASTRPIYNGINQNQARPKPMASVRPMQAEMGQSGRQRGWIPASVWQRQGMSAQEMTLPLDVVIPTNAADRASIVLKAGQKVMVLKSPKGIYMQLENGKIIAIRTAFKVGGKKPGEQVKVNPTEMTPRRGIRQIGAPRGRPVRAVGPVTRPPPVSVTVTKKRLSEDEQSGRKEDESETSEGLPTPMDVTESPSTEKESSSEGNTPNPFTAAAAASLSTMQVSPSGEEHKQIDSPDHMTRTPEKQLASPHTLQLQSHTPQVSSQLQKPPTPIPIQPQVTISPQPQASVPPLSSKPIATPPQVSVQPLVQSSVNAPPPAHASVLPSSSNASRQPSPSRVSSVQPSPSHTTLQLSPSHASIQPSSTHSSVQPSPSHTPMQPSPSHTSVQPSPTHTSAQPSPSHASVQHPVANSKTSSVQPHHSVPVTHQPQQPMQVPMETQATMRTRSPMHMQHSVQAHHTLQNQPAHSQPIQPQPVYSNQGQVPVSPHSMTPLAHSQSSTSLQSHNQGPPIPYSQPQSSVTMQTQPTPMMAQPQVSTSMQTHSQGSSSVQTSIQTSVPLQTHTSTQASASIQTHPSSSLQSHTQTSSSMQTHPQAPTPLQPQPPILHPQYSIPPHPQAPFPIQQPHHPHSSPYSMQPPQQKQGHFPSLPPHQFPLPPQQSQYPMSPQQSQFLGHPAHQFPMHPQPQYPPIHPQQPYPVQPQPQYPLQPHLQQTQFGGQPPHQFPLHPQPQFPMQSPSQFDQAPPVPSSMMTDHLS